MSTKKHTTKPLAPAAGSARLEAMKVRERKGGRIWCSLCKTYGNHYSSECPTPLGMVAPNHEVSDRRAVTGTKQQSERAGGGSLD